MGKGGSQRATLVFRPRGLSDFYSSQARGRTVMYGDVLWLSLWHLNGFTERLKERFSPPKKKIFQCLTGFGLLRDMVASI